MKFAIVTGASKGLGLEIKKIYEENGWNVCDLSRTGISDNHIKVDLAYPKESVNVLNDYLSNIAIDDIDELVFINNAAILTPIKINGSIMEEDILNSININISSAWLLINTLIKRFRNLNVKKSIINISSGAALKGYPGWSLYCGCKAACENYINAIFLEEVNMEFPFNIINFDPGVMDTGMQREIRSSNKIDFPQLDRFIQLKNNGDLVSSSKVANKLFSLIDSKPKFEKCRFSYKDLS